MVPRIRLCPLGILGSHIGCHPCPTINIQSVHHCYWLAPVRRIVATTLVASLLYFPHSVRLPSPSSSKLIIYYRLTHDHVFFRHFPQVWVARNPPGFAFVWFADDRDATDAVREVDGRSINGREWRVEIVSLNSPYFLEHSSKSTS